MSAAPIAFKCPFCGSTATPQIKDEITTASWVQAVVLGVLTCGVFLIPYILLSPDWRTRFYICNACGNKSPAPKAS